jgi:NAD(P)-dependent dehydrogenase (short-subunit alcohol dehydrogenase family)
MKKVWLITGSGNGLGRDIAEAALAAGDSVVAGARRTEDWRRCWRTMASG